MQFSKFPGRRLLAGICGCAVLAAAAAFIAREPAHGEFRDMVSEGELDGVWRSRGYGWLLAVDDGDFEFYDESASLCIEDEDASREMRRMKDDFEVSGDGLTIRLPMEEIAYQYTFDRIGALPARCETRPDSGPGTVVNAVIDLFNSHYPFFGARGVDWPRIAQAARDRVSAGMTSGELLDIVGGIVTQIDDAHVSLKARRDGATVWREAAPRTGVLHALEEQAAREGVSAKRMRKRWEKSYWKDGIAEELLDDDGESAANGKIQFGMLEGGIGYLAIRSMEDLSGEGGMKRDLKTLDKVMDRAMKRFAKAKARAVIVDVSINDGGYDAVALALAGRFASERTLAYYKHAGDSNADRPQPIHIDPASKRRFTGPVYVMTSDATVSAAEIFVLAMRALPNAVQVGSATRGSLSDILAKPLPNGWSINLSNEVYLDADGRSWEGKGIPPKTPLGIFSPRDVMTGHVAAVRAVARMARKDERAASSLY